MLRFAGRRAAQAIPLLFVVSLIVFTLIIPVLLWRSLTTRHHEEEE